MGTPKSQRQQTREALISWSPRTDVDLPLHPILCLWIIPSTLKFFTWAWPVTVTKLLSAGNSRALLPDAFLSQRAAILPDSSSLQEHVLPQQQQGFVLSPPPLLFLGNKCCNQTCRLSFASSICSCTLVATDHSVMNFFCVLPKQLRILKKIILAQAFSIIMRIFIQVSPCASFLYPGQIILWIPRDWFYFFLPQCFVMSVELFWITLL